MLARATATDAARRAPATLVRQLRWAQTLARELRPGAVVIHNTAHDYDGGEWRQLEALQIPTSWNDFHPIYVHLRE